MPLQQRRQVWVVFRIGKTLRLELRPSPGVDADDGDPVVQDGGGVGGGRGGGRQRRAYHVGEIERFVGAEDAGGGEEGFAVVVLRAGPVAEVGFRGLFGSVVVFCKSISQILLVMIERGIWLWRR